MTAGMTVSEKPILFSGPMVRAILEGRKTQTRRVANVRGADRVLFIEHGKLVPSRKDDSGFTGWVAEVDKLGGRNGLHLPLSCPYGKPGDRLWVRESIQKRGWTPDKIGSECLIRYQATDECLSVPTSDAAWVEHRMQSKVPSIHMPRWASRLTLEIAKVRVERLQEISEEDAQAEGAERKKVMGASICGANVRSDFYRDGFHDLWDSINSKRGFGWDRNPWVWVISFRRVSP